MRYYISLLCMNKSSHARISLPKPNVYYLVKRTLLVLIGYALLSGLLALAITFWFKFIFSVIGE